MKTLGKLLHCDGRTDAVRYQRNVAALSAAKALADLMVLAATPGTDARLIVLSWLNPFVLVKPWLNGEVPWVACATTLVLFSVVVWNTVHRLRDAGRTHWLGILTLFPYAGPLITLLCCFLPTRRHTVWDLV